MTLATSVPPGWLARLTRPAAALAAALVLATAPARAELRQNFYPDGTLRTRWELRAGPEGPERHGAFQRFHPNGVLALDGRYQRDRPAGEWRWFDERGTLLKKVLYGPEGEDVLAGQSLKSPRSTFFTLSRIKLAEGQLKYDKPHGPWKYWYPDGALKAEGTYETGIPVGRWVYYHPNGQIGRITEYALGVPDGETLATYPSGEPEERGRLDHGIRTGRWRQWYANGSRRSEGVYVEDLKEGEWRTWSEQGELVSHVRYQADVEVEQLLRPKPPPPEPVISDPLTLPFLPRLYDANDWPIRARPEGAAPSAPAPAPAP
ncbi:MAG: toxin-antitoxin system YwqK family antitoxin [Candidatus Lambdaproteobacteria bacterium]|nr:toxin-antitoxin system YwqK family antitoxin [Candidatus Lambdaproteobacteria bacterium]